MGVTSRGLRVALLLLGLALTGVGLMMASGPYRDLRDFETARHCASAGQRDCIEAAKVTVLDRSTYTTDSDTDNTPYQPPPAPPAPPPMPPMRFGLALPEADGVAMPVTHYRVTVRTPDGRRHKLNVNSGVYQAAKPGTTADAEVWRGHLTRLTLGSASATLPPAPGFFTAWLVAWAGVVLLTGTLLYPLDDYPVFGSVWFGVLGTIVYGWFSDWRPAAYVVPAVMVTAMLVWRHFFHGPLRPRRRRGSRHAAGM